MIQQDPLAVLKASKSIRVKLLEPVTLLEEIRGLKIEGSSESHKDERMDAFVEEKYLELETLVLKKETSP
ncbi:MAG: hypothetical protein K0U24_03665 [Gammaproteobacteria bacterium]|nr:hypothetical protein [Gammaproteobacteria bacterium]MCH9763313.1 hypothetical protein [Gammaproteobacteria bacterium]